MHEFIYGWEGRLRDSGLSSHPYQPYRKGVVKVKKVLSDKQREPVQKLVSFRSVARKSASEKI